MENLIEYYRKKVRLYEMRYGRITDLEGLDDDFESIDLSLKSLEKTELKDLSL